MSFFGRKFWRRRELELTKTERYIQREFEDAIRCAQEEWEKFQSFLRHQDPKLVERPLMARLNLFAGPVNHELETRFPKIAEVAEDMRRRSGISGHEIVIHGAIVKEALVRAGEDRAELRKIIDESD